VMGGGIYLFGLAFARFDCSGSRHGVSGRASQARRAARGEIRGLNVNGHLAGLTTALIAQMQDQNTDIPPNPTERASGRAPFLFDTRLPPSEHPHINLDGVDRR
jgi:hypothetical protein